MSKNELASRASRAVRGIRRTYGLDCLPTLVLARMGPVALTGPLIRSRREAICVNVGNTSRWWYWEENERP